MKQKIILVAMLVLLAALGVWCWYWYEHGGQAAKLARSPDVADRLRAIRLLTGKSHSLALTTLDHLADDAELSVAVQATRAIGKAGSDRARVLVGAILRRARTGRVRGEAAAVLGQFEGTDAKLLAVTLAEDLDAHVRAGAARGLARLHARAGLAALVGALRDKDPMVREVAIVAIQKVIGARFLFSPRASEWVRERQVDAIVKALEKHKML
ncbi:hypothetical protein LCGC14_1613390 [marine sediment metagenome]|uniref:HEAT repeat domain-containing protein n=1 Tax=marine sediment metagenome TaxID=412755 RepID=A0A0F9L7S4_9ZZZZ